VALLCRQANRRILTAVSLLLPVVSALTIVWLVRHGSGASPGIWNNTFVQFQMFGMGALLALHQNGRVPTTSALVRCALLAAGGALFLVSELVFHMKSAGATTVGMILGYLCSGIASCLLIRGLLGVTVPRWLKPAVYLGTISYGLYVFHLLGLLLTNELIGPSKGLGLMLFKIAFALCLTAAMAALSYRFIESPFIRLKERFAVIKSRGV